MSLWSWLLGVLCRVLPEGRAAGRFPAPSCAHCGKPPEGKGLCPICYDETCAACLRPHIDARHPINTTCPKCGAKGRFHPQLGISIQVPGTDVLITGYCECTGCGALWDARGGRNAGRADCDGEE